MKYFGRENCLKFPNEKLFIIINNSEDRNLDTKNIFGGILYFLKFECVKLQKCVVSFCYQLKESKKKK